MSCSCFGRRDKHAYEPNQDEEGKHFVKLLHGEKYYEFAAFLFLVFCQAHSIALLSGDALLLKLKF